jgi:hypothetical protein
LEHDIGNIRDYWIVIPLIIGIFTGLCACVISAANSLHQLPLIVPFGIGISFFSIYMVRSAKGVAVESLRSYTRWGNFNDDSIRQAIEILKEKAKFDTFEEKK